MNLSSNNFASMTSIYNPNKLFVTLASVPRLKRLNLSCNKLVRIHFEEMQVKSITLKKLSELDMSYNLIEAQEGLLYC